MNDSSIQQSLIQTFLHESEDLLSDIEETALVLGSEDETSETVHKLFRAFHTLKGSSAMCGFERVAGFTHHLENLLEKVREGSMSVTPTLVDLVLKARDHIKLLLAAEHGGVAPPQKDSDALVSAIGVYGGTGSPESGQARREPEPQANRQRTWAISFRPARTLLAHGGNPAGIFRDLYCLGDCTVVAHLDEVPTLDEMQPDHCYVWWTISLQTACCENDIKDAFIFVESDSKIMIEVADEPDLVTPSKAAKQVKATGTVRTASPEPDPAPAPRKESAKESSVRVPATRLDGLVNLVGELVINQSRLAQAASHSGAPEFMHPVQELQRLVAELRDNVLGIRMLPIGTLFGRFRRLVHDLSVELGKEVDLVTEGAETEMDKSILDQLGEPLVHCLRNSLDHGVEPAEERVAKGKPRRATIRLSAVHTGSDVVIRIEDDGRGINREAVRRKAIEKNLIASDANLSDKDILNLILLPGFSTAQAITSVSGRGVGMDAVKRQIDGLRGSLTLTSEAGKGTRTQITLPLTLAIIDGLLCEIGGDQFIVPMAVVTENVDLPNSLRNRNNGRNVIAVRGELIPYLDLRSVFDISQGPQQSVSKVVIVQQEEQRVGLLVDSVLGTHQTVIQSLGKVYRNIHVVSGATIMGDGRVALILDVAAIVRHAERQCAIERNEDALASPFFQLPGSSLHPTYQDLPVVH